MGGRTPDYPERLRNSQRDRLGADHRSGEGRGARLRAHHPGARLPDGPEFAHRGFDSDRRQSRSRPAASAICLQRLGLPARALAARFGQDRAPGGDRHPIRSWSRIRGLQHAGHVPQVQPGPGGSGMGVPGEPFQAGRGVRSVLGLRPHEPERVVHLHRRLPGSGRVPRLRHGQPGHPQPPGAGSGVSDARSGDP